MATVLDVNPGTAAQLAAVGPQDVFVHMNPEVTSFKFKHKRHVPFATTETPVDFPVLKFGDVSSVILPFDGDILTHMYLEVKLPTHVMPSPEIGKYLLKRAKLVIDDVIIQEHERLWYDISDAIHTPRRKQLVQRSSHVVYIPLQFIENVPLVAMSKSVVRVDIELEQPDAVPGLDGVAPNDIDVVLLCTYVDIDPAEEAVFRTGEHMCMFQAPQDMDEISYWVNEQGRLGKKSLKIDLSECNRPVSHLAFVAFPDSAPTTFQYLDILNSATVLINGQEQFEQRPPSYFRLCQKYMHCDAVKDDNIHVFSFALRVGLFPENEQLRMQPSGSLNFSGLKNPQLKVEFVNPEEDIKIKVFASTINWLRISNGFATLVFN